MCLKQHMTSRSSNDPCSTRSTSSWMVYRPQLGCVSVPREHQATIVVDRGCCDSLSFPIRDRPAKGILHDGPGRDRIDKRLKSFRSSDVTSSRPATARARSLGRSCSLWSELRRERNSEIACADDSVPRAWSGDPLLLQLSRGLGRVGVTYGSHRLVCVD